MKYPQLVSTRAVNAISDWLVSRLEQLGVEAPLIYSRLLLSLLHSSVQINDPIEFNNLETYLINRKGQKRHHHYHHYPPTDANTLKKLTAIQCLSEAVSSDQEISKIETLVDELCVKLNDIEKEIDSDDKEYQTIEQILNFITVVGSTTDSSGTTTTTTTNKSGEIANTSVSSSTSSSSSALLASKATGTDNSNFAISSVEEKNKSYNYNNIRNKNSLNLNIFTKQRNNKSNKSRVVIDLKDIEDPRKRYYNAFPALTKEMEDSFRNSNRYTKALTWPNDKTTSFIQQHINDNNNCNNINNNNNKHIVNTINNNNNNLNSTNINNQNEVYIRNNSNNLNNINTAGVKRKPKRRRNQVMSKGRSNNNNNNNNNNNHHQRKHSYSGNCSPTWDTDFEGSWEMGRDLIKEFIMRENNRNRSTSESAAYNDGNNNNNNTNNNNNNLNSNIIIEEIKRDKSHSLINNNSINDQNVLYDFITKNHQNKNLCSLKASIQKNLQNSSINLQDLTFQCSISSVPDNNNIMQEEDISSTTTPPKVLPNMIILDSNNLQIINNNNLEQNNLLLSDEGYSTHENLTSLSEIDISGQDIIELNKNDKMGRNHYLNSAQRRLYERDRFIDNNNNDETSMSLCSNIEQQQYDFAQFKAKFDSSVEALWKNNNNINNIQNDQNDNSNFSTNSDELRSLPFEQSQQQLQQYPQQQQRQGLNNFLLNYYNHRYDTNKFQNFDESNKQHNINENIEQRDFLSMPNQIYKVNSDYKPLTSSVFLQDSIWSDSVKNYDDDESFYANVKRSLKHRDSTQEEENNNYENFYENYPQDITKCQEGINEITIDERVLNSTSLQQPNSYSGLNYEMREIMLNNPNFYNYLQQNLPSNDMLNFAQSCNEEEYDDEVSNFNEKAKEQFQPVNVNESNGFPSTTYRNIQVQPKQLSPPVTLENHSKNSAFLEYSSIKKQNIDNFPQLNYKKWIDNNNPFPKYSGPTYTEDENLLTSDRTHFRPIKQTYADGYVFDICNYVDEIEYERSDSGFLCYDGEKYLEFTKNKNGINNCEDDQNLINEKISNNETSSNHHTNIMNKREQDEFILKFRINNKNEKNCQTDPPPPVVENPLCIINFGNYFHLQNFNANNPFNKNLHNQFISESESENASNYYYFEEENRSSTSTDDYDKFDGSFIYNTSSNTSCSNIESAKAAAAVIMAAVENSNHQFISNKKLQVWSMYDISKKCNANCGINAYNSIGNNTDSHTLWGTCLACNSNQELESIPANRLLKDELKIEGDEILSDLKYMQDLYIGSDWEEGTCSSSGSDSDNFASDVIETDYEIDKNSEINLKGYIKNKNKKLALLKEENYFYDTKNNNNIIIDENSSKDESQQTDLYYNVTKLIADLLKPENAKSLANALGEAAIQAANVHSQINNNNNSEMINACNEFEEQEDSKMDSFCGGIWTNDENIIWKHNELKPLDNYLTRFNSNNNNNNNNTLGLNEFSAKLNWEYSNLADIWKNESQFDSTNNSTKKNSIQFNEKENIESENFKHIKYDIRDNSKISRNPFEFDKNKNGNLLNTFNNENKDRTSNISQQNKILKENLIENNKNINNYTDLKQSEFTIPNINTNSYFGINKKNNRFDRKRRHSASQMVTSSCSNNDFISNATTAAENTNLTDAFTKTSSSSTTSSSINSIQNNNNKINTAADSLKFNINPNNTTINNIFGKGRENLKFQISNNCRNFLNNCQNIIDGGDSIKNKKHFNFYENFIIEGNKIELMTTAAKDLLIKTNLNDYVVGNDGGEDDDDSNNNNNNDDDTKVTSTTTDKAASDGTTSGGDVCGATIISCNYWTLNTKMDVTTDFMNPKKSEIWQKGSGCLEYDNIGGGISTISPSSILKHVALVSRPLTR